MPSLSILFTRFPFRYMGKSQFNLHRLKTGYVGYMHLITGSRNGTTIYQKKELSILKSGRPARKDPGDQTLTWES